MRYIKKPVEVEAMQWPLPLYENKAVARFFDWLWQHCDEDDVVIRGKELIIQTIHDGQWVPVKEGDYVVREPKRGRFYPVKQDIFEANHELAQEAS